MLDSRVVKVRRQWIFDLMTEPNDNYYNCFCSTHAHQYLYALSVVGIILSFLSLLCALCAAQFRLTLPPLVALLVFSITYIGNHNAIPILYVPLMIVQILLVLLLIGSGVFVVGYGSALIFNVFMMNTKSARKRAEVWIGIVCMCLGLLLLISALLLTYLTQVVYKAFRYLKDVVIGYRAPRCLPDYAHSC